jgi:hypothetical protein
MSQVPFRLVQTVLSASVSVWLAREAGRAFKTGRASGRYLSFRRHENPMLFWLIVTLQICFSGIYFFSRPRLDPSAVNREPRVCRRLLQAAGLIWTL